jgi:hypothetical protein
MSNVTTNKSARQQRARIVIPAGTFKNFVPRRVVKHAGKDSLATWLTRAIEPEEPLLGYLFTTTCRCLLFAETGSGKTMIGMAWAFAMALARSFLHWEAKRRGRVLYIDGEMSCELTQDRLRLACEWFGVKDAGDVHLTIINTEDYEDLQPLDTEEGQRWLDRYLERNGPFDFIVFDSIMSLCSAVMKEEEGWKKFMPYLRTLTRRRIGQLWLHHTGHDNTRSYGTKTREWEMDTVIFAETLTPDHPYFDLQFKKARRKTPRNWRDFAPMRIELTEEGWQHEAPTAPALGRPNQSESIALMALESLGGEATNHEWEQAAYKGGISGSEKANTKRKAFCRARDVLVNSGAVTLKGGLYRVHGTNDKSDNP